MKTAFFLIPALALTPAFGQLTREQKLHDFQNLAALYAKRYAPQEWKKQAVNFDLYDVKPWIERVGRSSSDLEFYEICAEYVAGLDDLHTSFRLPSSFFADLNFFVDIYDGKVLVESINRQLLPVSRYPFQIGDELVSVDGVPVEQLMDSFSRLRKRGNPRNTRRAAADLLTFRPQSTLPRAVELGDSATFVIRRASGDLETYEAPWRKVGVPLTNVGPVPGAFLADTAGRAAIEEAPSYLRPWLELTNFRAPEDDPLLQGETWDEETGETVPRRYLLGYGARNPRFAAGLPANFRLRLGSSSAHFHFSGTYEVDGVRIGYLRFPNFSPPSTQAAVNELVAEVAFLEANTDGLVVDVMRNTGGGCYMLTAASLLIPHQFFFFGEQIRPTLDRINAFDSAIRQLRALNADQWILDLYTVYLEQMQQAYKENRGLTGPIPACSLFLNENEPARGANGQLLAYTKPLIVLVDEFSTSAGDIFPAMLQDNGRGPLVGMRTNGAGGSISSWSTGFYSESQASNTNSLVVRREPIRTAEFPTAPYIENIGVRPDIELDIMTRDNLLQGGRPFVDAFNAILIGHIRGTR